MDLKIGIIGKFWTPMAAEQAAWVLSQLTPQNGQWFPWLLMLDRAWTEVRMHGALLFVTEVGEHGGE